MIRNNLLIPFYNITELASIRKSITENEWIIINRLHREEKARKSILYRIYLKLADSFNWKDKQGKIRHIMYYYPAPIDSVLHLHISANRLVYRSSMFYRYEYNDVISIEDYLSKPYTNEERLKLIHYNYGRLQGYIGYGIMWEAFPFNTNVNIELAIQKIKDDDINHELFKNTITLRLTEDAKKLLATNHK